ncbi:MAG TPA: excinuclease ABC subunit A, partial [Opitutales bacterium]|nr:excinuclease ABC subunit A [Opitutales bacterium]
ERLTVVCGPSGAGKSTLIRELLAPAVAATLAGEKIKNADYKKIEGLSDLKGVLEVDQSPIGLTSRSTPTTYIGAFDLIRDLYASTPEAKWRGLTRSAFSFNTAGGRCSACLGSGTIKLEMNFLPRASIPCDACGGKRYGPEVEPVLWKSLTIGECLERTFEEAVQIFEAQPKLKALCALMVETGLGYLTLGQPSPTLSGGEAQRLKLVYELSRGLAKPGGRDPRTQKHLYILEEPTLGLHAHDVLRLLGILHRLVDQGHTVVVIEHHLDVIADADYVVELGPTGGPLGGHILYQGALKGLLKIKNSPTGPFLAKMHSFCA